MTNKLSRRNFLLSAAAALLSGRKIRFWEKEAEVPPSGYIQYWGELPDDFEVSYLDWLRQRQAVSYWPIILKMSDMSWELEGDAEHAKHIETILRKA
jgi:hypothetical protein